MSRVTASYQKHLPQADQVSARDRNEIPCGFNMNFSAEEKPRPDGSQLQNLAYDVHGVHEKFPLPSSTDEKIPSKNELSYYFFTNPSLVRVDTDENHSDEPSQKKARRETTKKAVDSVWFR